MISPQDRQRFDSLLDHHVEALPEALRSLLEEVPLIVEDEADAALLRSLGMDPSADDLCGLHDGVPMTEQSVEAPPAVPTQLMMFRGPIVRLATGGRRRLPAPGSAAWAELDEQIRITLLHEIGHHFGLDEDDLDQLGYG